MVGFKVCGSLRVMVLGWRIKVQPDLGGQCVLGGVCYVEVQLEGLGCECSWGRGRTSGLPEKTPGGGSLTSKGLKAELESAGNLGHEFHM